MLHELHTYLNRNSWAKLVNTVLKNLGFYNAWINQGVENESFFLNV